MLVDNLIAKYVFCQFGSVKDLNFDLAYHAVTKIKVYKKVKQRFIMIGMAKQFKNISLFYL